MRFVLSHSFPILLRNPTSAFADVFYVKVTPNVQ